MSDDAGADDEGGEEEGEGKTRNPNVNWIVNRLMPVDISRDRELQSEDSL